MSTDPAPRTQRRRIVPLTDLAIKKAIRAGKASDKPKKYFDQRHLFLMVMPGGSALWRFRYHFEGREKLISLGAYADVPLKLARDKYDDARRLVAAGVDPSAARKASKLAQENSVEALYIEWLDKQTDLSAGTIRRDRQRLDEYIKPYLGKRPINSVTPQELLAPLRRIESTGKRDTAIRTRALCGRIWRYAIATGRAERDIAADLKDALQPAASTNYGALTDPKAIGGLLRAIDTYMGQPVVRCALRLGPLVFVRPGELRKAEWSEFDLDAEHPEWRIPAEEMKMKSLHIVPLATQSVAVLREIAEHTGGGRYVFPSLRSGGRPMSENAINAALRRMGFEKEEQTGHGFRTIASTLLNELGWHPDLIELQLAHAERNKVRAAYNKAQRLEERRKMMQAWADHLDTLRTGDKKVVPIRKRVAS